MKPFRDWSLQRKLTLILTATCAIVLAAATAAFLTNELRNVVTRQTRNLSVLAEVLGDNTAAALVFQDAAVAERNLHGLLTNPDVDYACVLDQDNRVFAEIWQPGKESLRTQARMLDTPHRIVALHNFVRSDIVLDGERIGSLVIAAHMSSVKTQSLKYAQIAALIFVATLSLGYIIARYTQRLVASPIVKLAETARHISDEGDYSIRAAQAGATHDETGDLVAGFNQMLDKIEIANNEIRAQLDFMEKLINTIPMPFFYHDMQNICRQCNGKFAALFFSAKPAEITGQELWTGHSCAPGLVAAMADQQQVLLESRQPQSLEMTIQCADGVNRTFIVSRAAVLDTAGNPAGVVGVMLDVTNQRTLEQEVLKAASIEQRRIAQDLHDGLGALLTAVLFKTEALQAKLEKDKSIFASSAGGLASMTTQAISQLRALAKGLDPVDIATGGLPLALERLANNTSDIFHIDCRFQAIDDLHLQDDVVCTHLYRIAQEAITNAVRHSGATVIRIRAEMEDHQVILSIEDNGKGLPVDAVNAQGLGMKTMAYRARSLRGSLKFDSQPPGGTTVVCTIPVQH